jgi:methylthioribose-1-phosphate isomerase
MRALGEREGRGNLHALFSLWKSEAALMQAEDIAVNKRMGEHGAALLEDGDTVLTHCNAGALATAGHGTALGVMYSARSQGKRISVIADETRPFLQGARLTAYELHKAGVHVTVACDNACALLMRRGLIQKVIVGADRIAANGDVANKIGTYGVALLAKAHGIPFYVAAPLSTIDRNTPDGEAIPIEERPDAEVSEINGKRIIPQGVPVYNFAFDVTPAELVAGIITEQGILRPPYAQSIAEVFAPPGARREAGA